MSHLPVARARFPPSFGRSRQFLDPENFLAVEIGPHVAGRMSNCVKVCRRKIAVFRTGFLYDQVDSFGRVILQEDPNNRSL